MHHDRGGVVADHARTRQIQRHRRPGHVADGQVGQQRDALGHLGLAVELGGGLHQPGHADRRKVSGQHALQAAHGLLHRCRGGLDMGQALGQIGDMGTQAHQAHRGLCGGGGITRGPQRHRHRRHQRLARQRGMLAQVAPQGGGADHQHDVVEGGLMRPPQQLELRQRQADSGKGPPGGDRLVEKGARRQAQVADPLALVLATQQGRIRQRLAGGIGQGAQGGRQVLDDARHLRRLIGNGPAQHLAQAQAQGLAALAGPDLQAAALGRGVQDHLGHGHCGLAVHRRMVELRVQPHPAQAAGAEAQALQQVKAPERPLAVQALGMQVADGRLQLGHAVA